MHVFINIATYKKDQDPNIPHQIAVALVRHEVRGFDKNHVCWGHARRGATDRDNSCDERGCNAAKLRAVNDLILKSEVPEPCRGFITTFCIQHHC